MDDVQSRRIDIKQALDISLGVTRHGNYSIGHFQCSLLDPDRKIVPTAELLPLPRPQRLEGVHGNDQRNAVIQFREDAAEMTVPSMTMREIGVDLGRIEISAA